MEFKDYVKRINSVKEIKTFGQISPEKQKQKLLSIKNNKMILQEIEKSKFAQINDKRHYFSDGIVSLPFSHPYLHEIVKFKREKNKKIEALLQQKNTNLFKWKNLQGKITTEYPFIGIFCSKSQHFFTTAHKRETL